MSTEVIRLEKAIAYKNRLRYLVKVMYNFAGLAPNKAYQAFLRYFTMNRKMGNNQGVF